MNDIIDISSRMAAVAAARKERHAYLDRVSLAVPIIAWAIAEMRESGLSSSEIARCFRHAAGQVEA
jgi:hypothetical protein